MSTRLDRLVALLDSGSTPAVRETAARQLGQAAVLIVRGGAGANSSSTSDPSITISKPEPNPKEASEAKEINSGASTPLQSLPDPIETVKKEQVEDPSLQDQSTINPSTSTTDSHYIGPDGEWFEATNLIAKVLPYLRSKSWDTRVAAAQAIECICHASGTWDPLQDLTEEKGTSSDVEMETRPVVEMDSLTFESFSLKHILTTGTRLLSSAGKEYEMPAGTVAERLARAKADLSKLGLGGPGAEDMDIGMDVEAELRAGEEVEASKGSFSTTSAPTSSLPPPRFAPKAAGISALAPPKLGRKATASTIDRRPASSGGELPATPPAPPSENSNVSSPGITTASPQEETGEAEIDLSKLSARERNQLKRKRKLESKNGGGDNNKSRILEAGPSGSSSSGLRLKTAGWGSAGSIDSPATPATPMTPASSTNGQGEDYLTSKGQASGPSAAGTPIGGAKSNSPTLVGASLVPSEGEWPFRLVSELLFVDLFSPAWETRHGAALGLRGLFKTQGSGGGKLSTNSFEANQLSHQRWCDDASIKLLCVFALDRLGDFVFDHVVAPVRETVSQTLASLFPFMPSSSVRSIHQVLLQMIWQDETSEGAEPHSDTSLGARRGNKGYAWEVRHAGFLGLRFQVTVRADMLLEESLQDEDGDFKMSGQDGKKLQPSKILTDVVDVAVLGLRDDDDDVRAAAAAALLPLVDVLVKHMPSATIVVLDQVWDCLGDLKDDLSSSTGGVMDLLSKLVEHPSVIDLLNVAQNERSLSALIPRLYPFFRHTISSVRLSILNALKVFLSTPSIPQGWVDDRVLRLLFQNLVVEERASIRNASKEAWMLAVDISARDLSQLVLLIGPHLKTFFAIIMTPLGSPIDFSLFFQAAGVDSGRHNIDKGVLAQDLTLIGVDAVIRGRLGAASALGKVLAYWPRDKEEEYFGSLLRGYFTASALQMCLSAVIAQEWAESSASTSLAGSNAALHEDSEVAAGFGKILIRFLESPAPSTYSEMVVMLQRVQLESQGLYNSFGKEAKLPKAKIPELPTTVDPLGQMSNAFTVDMAKEVAGSGYESLVAQLGPKARKTSMAGLEQRRMKLIASIGFYTTVKSKQDTQVFASVAAAVISLKLLPSKLNPVIRSIMNSVKGEENADLQARSAKSVARFIDLCSSPSARANPSDKIVKNLCAFICQDTTRTAVFEASKTTLEGILSLDESAAPAPSRGRGAVKEEVVESDSDREGKLLRRGAEIALQEVATHFGPLLFEVIPMLWDCIGKSLLETFDPSKSIDEANSLVDEQPERGQGTIDCCSLLSCNVPNLDKALHPQIVNILPSLSLACQSKYAVIRSAAAKCYAVLADQLTEETMKYVIDSIVPLVGDSSRVVNRQGSVETLSHIVRVLDVKLLPYVIFLVVPILGRMSDPDNKVRLTATNTFASLIKMVPLEAGLPDPPGFSTELLRRREDERKFLTQLLSSNKVEPYEIPVKINAELRNYQKEGVSWMAFLAKYQLHGILCDDMGLGKTLQSICILSSKHHERAQKWKATKSPDSVHLPSLVICPPTLGGHWVHEVQRYANNLKPLLYQGFPADRARLRTQFSKVDVVITSYDTVRNDIEYLSRQNWHYCVLDEGHIIKNSKTDRTKAVKQIKATHRLVLSGTPIQNNVLELWSLFDFLMPGFLGSERAFHDKFGKPILAIRDGKVTAKEREAATFALDALHKQVLPFLLRRLKEDTLADLPPKIIQDIECELGDLQKLLYEDFSRSQDRDEFESSFGQENKDSEGKEKPKQQVFATMQYLRKLVCHPSLVYDPSDANHRSVLAKLGKSDQNLEDLHHAPKLLALRQLLNDCGIGNSNSGANSAENELSLTGEASAVSQHRVLIFCQLKPMLDLIEKSLFRKHMPSVSYLRLDGSVPSEKRHGICNTFNSDPSIDVLLLTTSVGGLGLTLTGADTVIFVEHDWNPMKDLQAMDRAHRLGQKKVVNVYRLITKNTLEQKIMGLQRFKLHVAGSVITQQNSGLDTMESDQILDLFDTSSSDATQSAGAQKKGQGKGISQKALLQGLEEMEAEEGEDGKEGTEYGGMKSWQPETVQ